MNNQDNSPSSSASHRETIEDKLDRLAEVTDQVFEELSQTNENFANRKEDAN